jgi:hypothetical protein
VVLGIHDIKLFAHHGRIQRALHLAQLPIASHTIADACLFYAFGDVLVGGVLCGPAHLFATLGLGALLGLHAGVVVLLLRGVLGRHNGAFAESKREVRLAYHIDEGAR